MKKTLFYILILINFSSFSQNTNYLKSYFPYINKAEEQIINNNLLKASEYYEMAFDSTTNAHLKDYFNAAVCFAYLGEADKVYQYLDSLAKKGLSLDFIKHEIAFASIQNDVDWSEYELKYLELKRESAKNINTNLKGKLDSLYIQDQWFRNKNETLFADTIRKVDQQNAIELQKLIEEYGFPFEDEIGLAENGYPIISYPFYEIIKRQTVENEQIDFSNHLLTAIREGKILPHMAVYLMALTNLNDEFFSRAIYKITSDATLELNDETIKSKVNNWVYVPVDEESESYINNLRTLNGMEDLGIYRKKILFSLNDHRFLFPYKAFAGIWYVTDPELIATYLEGASLVEQ